MEISNQHLAPATLSCGRSPKYPLNGRLSETQSWSECCEEDKYLFSLLGIEPSFISCPAHKEVITTQLSQFHFVSNIMMMIYHTYLEEGCGSA
jgi:hypothetical protein